ncbi:MAG: stage IV sporulation protein A [Ruminococcus sp.]|nr:stage IV sporulation protein A [Ruminococcus sp.]
MNSEIYTNISTRTDGDIYIGVVGPVRTGKSSFIKQFMEKFVIPRIDSEPRRERAVDELPQSAGGRTIMTTEPKFIPEEAVDIELEGGTKMSVRLIDCVGYIIPSAVGYIENEAPRMVMTPWFEDEVPFNMAAEVGTRKVITEHSTVGLVVTTDGSITDLPREEYEECEEKVINELKAIDKPFAVLLNSVYPESEEVGELAEKLSEKYGSPVIPVNCLELDEDDIAGIMEQLLYAFPVREVNIGMPSWINTLERDHWLRSAVFGHIRKAAEDLKNLRGAEAFAEELARCEYISSAAVSSIEPGTGTAVISASVDSSLFYRIIGEATGLSIDNESDLLPQILELVEIRNKYSKFARALNEVEETGYGIVMPSMDELTLEQPQVIRQGGKYGVRLRARAPSIHMMKAVINTEVAPIVGSERQSEDLVRYMMSDFENAPEKIWESNIFGKSLHELVGEGLHAKLSKLSPSARAKLGETIERMINEGCSGLICFIL